MKILKIYTLLLLGLVSTALKAGESQATLASFSEFNMICAQKLPTFLNHLENSKIKLKVSKGKTRPESDGYINLEDYNTYRAVNAQQFEETLDGFYKTLHKSSLVDKEAWINENGKLNILLDVDAIVYEPYVQKLVAEPKHILALRGDMHGDIHSLLNFLRSLHQKGYLDGNTFKITNPDLRLIFLGDYTDRGVYGVEVIYTLLRLKMENPDQVFMVRGNHEDTDITQDYGFDAEVKNKFNDATDGQKARIFKKLKKLYEVLPVALYIGARQNESQANYVQCCHGGLEIGFDPQELFSRSDDTQYQFVETLRQATQCQKLPSLITGGIDNESYKILASQCMDHKSSKPFTEKNEPMNGFMWSEFHHDPNAIVSEARGGYFEGKVGGFKYNKELTNAILYLSSSANHKLQGIFRAHQHEFDNNDPLMTQMLESYGVARLWSTNKEISFNPWSGIICTLLLSPDSSPAIKSEGFKGFDFDTTVFITVAPQFEEWQVKVVNSEIYKQ